MTHPSDSLRLRLDVPAQAAAAETVPITLRVENVSGRPLELYLRGREIAFDIIVEAKDGASVWRRLEGEAVPAILRLETLPAGEKLVLEAVWDQRANGGDPVRPGHYRVRGELLTDGDPLVSPVVSIRIGPDR